MYIKRFAICYRTVNGVVCLSVRVCVCLVTLVYCGQTVGWIKMPLDLEVGLDPGYIVLAGDPAAQQFPTFRPLSIVAKRLVYCGQTVGWIKMPIGTEVGRGPGDIVLGRTLPVSYTHLTLPTILRV